MSKATKSNCTCCGNAKFIACPTCNGSRKSTIHHFKFNSIALRCIKCNKNDGLVQCPVCDNDVHDIDKIRKTTKYFNLRRELDQHQSSQNLIRAPVLTDVDSNIVARSDKTKLDIDSNNNNINRFLHTKTTGIKNLSAGFPVLTNWNEFGSSQPRRTCRNTNQ